MEKQTFSKEERLSSRRLIEQVATQGKSFLVHPFKVNWISTGPEDANAESRYPAQVLMSVSKKKFPRAVDRNRVKRLMREAYRKNKHLLYKGLTDKNEKMALMLVYIGAGLPEYKTAEDKIILILQRLSSK